MDPLTEHRLLAKVEERLFGFDRAPLRIGRFVVLEQVGSGGMGVVVAAYDEELDRRVAIKLVRGGGNERSNERILNEARAQARLSHPNVVQVYEVGTHEGQVFVAMEFVRGKTLRQWLRAPRPWTEIVDAFVQAGRGLAAAHAEGIVHRDFKPANAIMGADGRVRVLDFGLALQHDTDSSAEPSPLPPESNPGTPRPRLTQTGMIMGTPAYMSPEQRVREPVGPASDQFSYCVALYEALYGERPFPEDERVPEAVPPRPARSRERPVPARLHPIVARGLAPAPAARWPSMDALLVRLLRARRRVRPRGVVVLGLALVTGALGYAAARPSGDSSCHDAREEHLVGTWDPAMRERLESAMAEGDPPIPAETTARLHERLDAQADAWGDLYERQCIAGQRGELSTAVRDRSLACLQRERLRLQQRVLTIELQGPSVWTRAVQAVPAPAQLAHCANPLVLPPTDSASERALTVDLFRAEALSELGDFGPALEIARAVEHRADGQDQGSLRAEALLLVAELQLETGKPEDAEAAASAALTLAEAEGNDMLAAQSLVQRAYGVGYHQARPEEGLRWAELAHAKLRRLELGNETIAAELESVTGAIHASRGEFSSAERAFERSLSLWEQSGGLGSTRAASTLDNLGHMAARLGRTDRAEEHYLQALALREQRLGPGHPDLARSLLALGNLYDDRGQPQRAIETFNRALAVQEASLGPTHPEVAVTYNSLGVSAMTQQDWPEARSKFERAIAILERGQTVHPHLAFALLNAANVAQELDDDPLATAHLRRVLEIAEQLGEPDGQLAANASSSLGRIELFADRCQTAEPLLIRALALREANEASPARIANAQLDLATVLWNEACGRTEPSPRAHALATVALQTYERLGEAHADELERAREWLADHPLPPAR
ncbi:MAG: serine/threonine-protein kinase [Myxococcota bacterium]